MTAWLLGAGLWLARFAVSAAYGYFCYRLGHKRGSALCPNDHVLRDVARQRDAALRERDQASAAAAHLAQSHLAPECELIRLRNAMQRGSAGPN